MARTIFVSQIIAQAQILTQDPDFILATSPQYYQFVCDEYTRLYAAYIAAEPDRFRLEIPFVTVPGTAETSVPGDWVATIGVDYVSGSVRRPMVRLMEADRTLYTSASGDPQAYRVIGTSIVLYPTPSTVMTFNHIYIPAPPTTFSGSDVIDCRLGHERYLQLCVARMLLNAENAYDGRWDQEIAQTMADLKMEANYRYFQDQPVMRSERQVRRRGWPFAWPFGGRW